MLEHVGHASSAANVGATISHHSSSMASSVAGAISGGTVVVVGSAAPNEAAEAGYWFVHAHIWIFTPQQICTIAGTICTLLCTLNIVYQFYKSTKTKIRKIKKPQETPTSPPVIQGGSGSGKPPIKPQ